jgi:single-strand DNA-binding protein
MTEASVSFAGNLTDDPELRHTEAASPGPRSGWPCQAAPGTASRRSSPWWCDQAEHAAESLTRGSRVVVVGRLQQRAWTAEDGSARSLVEVEAEEVGPSLRWATATPVRANRSASV